MEYPLVSIVCSTYNYGHFLTEAIESVLKQTYEKFQLIIVDDGSTDNTKEIMAKYQDERILYLPKENKGQLSTFNHALPFIKGDYVFLLDADDWYNSNYLEEILKVFLANPSVNFIFCETKQVPYNFPVFFPCTRFITAAYQAWVGRATSALSMKTSLYKSIFPLSEFEEDWRIRADDVIIFASSLLNASKLYYPFIQINYRIHENNGYTGTKTTPEHALKRQRNVFKLFHYFAQKEYLTFTKQGIISEYNMSPIAHLYYLEALKFLYGDENTKEEIRHYINTHPKNFLFPIQDTTFLIDIIPAIFEPYAQLLPQ